MINKFHIAIALWMFVGVSACMPENKLDCIYVPVESKSNVYPELTEFRNCGDIGVSGQLILSPSHMANIMFDDGLATVAVATGIYYINNNGKSARVLHFDNGADYFQEGLARTVSDNKTGFINRQLDVVIEPIYDFAFPFRNGLSRVCMDCIMKSDGEHTEVVDGRWGCIDLQGKIVVEIKYPAAELDLMDINCH